MINIFRSIGYLLFAAAIHIYQEKGILAVAVAGKDLVADRKTFVCHD